MASPFRVLVAAILFVPSLAFAQIAPTLHPGDNYRFLGANSDVSKGSGCDGTVNGCDVEYPDLGADKPRMYALTTVSVGVLSTTRTVTGRLASPFAMAPGPDRPIGAKLIGVVSWRGWLEADFGALDNTASSEIGVSLYEIDANNVRHLVANQTLHSSAVSGQLGVIPSFIRDFGSGGFDLSVNLHPGHSYLAAVEVTCSVTSGLVGIAAASSYSSYGGGRNALTDGYVEQSSMTIEVDPDYLAAVDSLRDEFKNHTHGYLTGRGVGQNNTDAVTTGPSEAAPTTAADVPSAGGNATLTMVTTAPDRVELAARLGEGAEAPVLERRSGDSDWKAVAEVAADGSVTDRSVVAGTRYGYRVRTGPEGAESTSDELWLDVPVQVLLGLEGAWPNPVAGRMRLTFSLPSSTPATLTLYDVAGRMVATREVGASGLGRHLVEWSSLDKLGSGTYLLKLSQDGRSVTSKVTFVR